MTTAQGLGLMLIVVLASFIGHDDSDPPGGRSGLSVYIDRKTGCQYLAVGSSMTPRLRADGGQVCSPPKDSR